MEGVEEANQMAVESCNRVLSVISQPQDLTQYRNLLVETEKGVSSFKRVVSLLSNGLGHARARIVKTNKTTTFRQSNLLESVNGSLADRSEPVKGLQQLKADLNECPVPENGSTTGESCLSLGGNLSNFSLERSSCGKSPHQISQCAQTGHYQFLQQQQLQQQKLQFQQHQLKRQNEMMHGRVNNGINLNFDDTSCTPTMSNTRSFISSLNNDGSVTNLNGNGFSLMGVSHSLDQLKRQNEMMHGRVNNGINLDFDDTSCTPTMSNTRSFISSLNIDGSVTNLNGNGFSLMGVSHSLDQNSSQHKKRCSSGGRCHCAKKRKNRVRTSIKVPAISDRLADIPPDDYSWRKYGQKPIKGSPYPRSYYKCSTVKGCPAKKHVERCLEESSMLIVTYEDDHNHPCVASRSANA